MVSEAMMTPIADSRPHFCCVSIIFATHCINLFHLYFRLHLNLELTIFKSKFYFCVVFLLHLPFKWVGHCQFQIPAITSILQSRPPLGRQGIARRNWLSPSGLTCFQFWKVPQAAWFGPASIGGLTTTPFPRKYRILCWASSYLCVAF